MEHSGRGGSGDIPVAGEAMKSNRPLAFDERVNSHLHGDTLGGIEVYPDETPNRGETAALSPDGCHRIGEAALRRPIGPDVQARPNTGRSADAPPVFQPDEILHIRRLPTAEPNTAMPPLSVRFNTITEPVVVERRPAPTEIMQEPKINPSKVPNLIQMPISVEPVPLSAMFQQSLKAAYEGRHRRIEPLESELPVTTEVSTPWEVPLIDVPQRREPLSRVPPKPTSRTELAPEQRKQKARQKAIERAMKSLSLERTSVEKTDMVKTLDTLANLMEASAEQQSKERPSAIFFEAPSKEALAGKIVSYMQEKGIHTTDLPDVVNAIIMHERPLVATASGARLSFQKEREEPEKIGAKVKRLLRFNKASKHTYKVSLNKI